MEEIGKIRGTLLAGHEVIVADNMFTGRKRNVEHWIGHPNFDLVNHDIVNPLYIEVDEIYHLASPASPPHYMYNPVKTIKTNTGTWAMSSLHNCKQTADIFFFKNVNKQLPYIFESI